MSLINEALKRAKQAQDATAPGPGLEFRPVDHAIANHRNQRVMLLATMGVVVLLAVLLIWQMAQTSRASRQARVAERAVAVANAAAAEPKAALPAAARPQGAEKTATIPQGTSGNDSKPSESPRLANATPAVSPDSGAEPQAAVEKPVTPAPEIAQTPKPAPKLQSIIYNPKRPSAMISGRIVLVGDKFGDWRITGIDQESATLVANGVTNVLMLQQ